MIYQDTNFKIRLSSFGWKENILPKMHIVQCSREEEAYSLCQAVAGGKGGEGAGKGGGEEEEALST